MEPGELAAGSSTTVDAASPGSWEQVPVAEDVPDLDVDGRMAGYTVRAPRRHDLS
jgi:hypothetical protein